MPHPLAIAFIHGIGRTERGYSEPMRRALADAFASRIGRSKTEASSELHFEENPLRYGRLRDFMVHFTADAVAYQPSPHDRSAYDAIHEVVAESLAALAERAGPRAPLCVVAHSLGTVIASNYLYDLMKRRGSYMWTSVRARI